MMRYRLRTLFLMLTCVAACAGWFAHLRHRAAFHRREVGKYAAVVALAENLDLTQTEKAVADYAAGWGGGIIHADDNGLRTFWNLFLTWNRKIPESAAEIRKTSAIDFQAAVRHRMLAAEYERAVLHPWEVVRIANLIAYDRKSN